MENTIIHHTSNFQTAHRSGWLMIHLNNDEDWGGVSITFHPYRYYSRGKQASFLVRGPEPDEGAAAFASLPSICREDMSKPGLFVVGGLECPLVVG